VAGLVRRKDIVKQMITRLAVLAGIVLAGGIVIGQSGTPSVMAAQVVNSTGDAADSSPGDGSCKTAGGVCTLRAAIEEANAFPGADTIEFSLGGPYPVIAPTSTLPALSTDITVKGNTGGATRVEISGASAGVGANGLNITTSGTVVVENVAVHSFGNRGICIATSGSVTIRGSHVGTDGAGTTALGNAHGIEINTCGFVPSAGTVLIGGPAVADRNVISDNALSGVSSTGPLLLASLIIQGNYVGTDAGGSVAMGNNTGIGVTNATIEGNLVSGNATGIFAGKSNVITGNLIGTKSGGAGALPNSIGLQMGPGTSNIVGGVAPGDANVIAGNTAWGVHMYGAATTDNQLVGNYIGVQADGVTPLGNGSDGVFIELGAHTNQIGGLNVIAHNGGAGVRIDATAGVKNHVGQNPTFSNGGLGLDVGAAGVTPNDPLDADGGANNQQNFPVLSAAVTTLGHTAIVGTLNSTPNAHYFIDYYASPSCDASGHGEGQVSLFGTLIQTDASGSSGQFGYVTNTSVPAGWVITAIVSDFTTGNADSSEFSACRTVTACVVGDSDCDSFKDVAPPTHVGPQNTDPSFDNCFGGIGSMTNPDQQNTDANFIDLSPPKAYDDITWPMSDGLGDVCDPDEDNDGRPFLDELQTGLCGGHTSHPLRRDTDGDRILDGAECALGTNPNLINAAPAACAVAGDVDGDKVLDSREFCYYGTKGTDPNSDGDTRNDGCEVYSINGDLTLNVIDLSQVSGSFGPYASPGSPVQVNFDVNKDGNINVLDLSAIAGADPFCP
jgi:CSLREA domain-containing protein